jgi:chaperonin GroES
MGEVIMTINIRPLQNRVIIKRLEGEEKTAGGIIIPDAAKEKPQQGEVMAVGPGKVLEKGARVDMTVNVGDRVLFGKYGGSEFNLEGEELLIMREDDILCVIKD